MCKIFECDACGNVDSIEATSTSIAGYLCHRCQTGEWHHLFPEVRYNPEEHGPALNRTQSVDGFDGMPSFS